VLKQDLLIGIVSVSAIVYVILFDGSPGGLIPGSNPATGTQASLSASARTTEPPGLLVIGSEGSPTPQARAKLVDEARTWIERPVPGDFERLKADFEAISQTADAIALYRVPLDEPLARAFSQKLSEVKRYYVLQRTTVKLAEVANNYLIPGGTEHEKIEAELARLRELERDVEWVEQRYDFHYQKDRKEYLKQLIDVLSGMKKI
jgi:hypothetical protein